MKLVDKQHQFTVMVAHLILWAKQQGYQVTFGEAYRTLQQAQVNAQQGRGIKNSAHCLRLAVDLNLFIDGSYQTDSQAYQALGEYWESMGGSWGGRFRGLADGNHFSLEHNGIR